MYDERSSSKKVTPQFHLPSWISNFLQPHHFFLPETAAHPRFGTVRIGAIATFAFGTHPSLKINKIPSSEPEHQDKR